MSGSILYKGPSLIDGKPIVVIATDSSKNRKNGGMIQTWILRDGVEPHTACKTGEDATVCGNCPHRPENNGSCYVTVFQGPLSVYRAYKRGKYGAYVPGQYTGRMVRIGSYGDPAAVPVKVWESYVIGSVGRTGYTHLWRDCDTTLQAFAMASCDSAEDYAAAKAAGWRTFRVRTKNEALIGGERVCPASDEAGKKLQCDQCKMCCGLSRPIKGDIAIIVHGSPGKAAKFEAKKAA